jgi:CHAT domain-containing protein/Tfp pilus assembly protein PilF
MAVGIATADAQVDGPRQGPKDSIDAVVAEADELIASGDHDAAIERLEERLAATGSANKSGQALLHTRLAIGHYYRRDLQGIREHAEAAIDLVGDDADALDIYADALAARALYLGASGKTREYLDVSKVELEVRRELPPTESELAIPLINIAIAYGERGDFEAAERYLLEALEYASAYEAATDRPTSIRSNLAWVYGMRKDYRAAARMLREVIEVGRERAPGSVNLSMRLGNLGSVLASMGRYGEARDALAEALSIQRESIPDSVDVARTTYALAQVAEAQDDKERAARLYRQAIDLADAQAPDSPGAAFPRRALSGLLIDRGELVEARAMLDQALSRTASTTNPGQHAATLFQLGRLELARDDRDAARRYWLEAVEALEIQYDLLGGSALTVANFSDAYEPLYRRLAQLLIDQGDYGEAIRLLESYRNRALLERIDVNRILRRSEAGGRLVSDLDELSGKARSIIDPGSPPDTRAVTPSERLAQLARQRRERVDAAIQQQPRLAEWFESGIRWRPETAMLDDGQRILYYSVGEKRSDLLVVAPDGVTAHRLPPRDSIATLVERLRILIQRPEADPAPLIRVSRRLYAALLEPAAEQLADADALVLRADGPLLLLPFAALRDSDDRYLVERYRIHRLHTLDAERRRAPEIDRGEETFTGFAYAGGADGESARRGHRGPLRHVGEEIDHAGAVFGERARLHVGSAASETRARQIGGKSIVHFASHAVADAIGPLSSHISLAADNDNDGRLEMWEVMADVRVDGGLVVLSACETALGPSFAGEGLFGLSKSFAFAGADAVVASLWSIDDASTMHLMELFYREIAAETAPAEALNRAQRAMLSGEIPERSWLARLFAAAGSDFTHPYYWAPFTLTRTR